MGRGGASTPGTSAAGSGGVRFCRWNVEKSNALTVSTSSPSGRRHQGSRSSGHGVWAWPQSRRAEDVREEAIRGADTSRRAGWTCVGRSEQRCWPEGRFRAPVVPPAQTPPRALRQSGPRLQGVDRRERPPQPTGLGSRTAPRRAPHSGHAVPCGAAASSYPHDPHRPWRSHQTPRAARAILGKEIVASTIIDQTLKLMPRPSHRTRVGTTLRGGWGSVMPSSPAAHSASDADTSWPSTVSRRYTRSCSARLFQT